MSKSIPVSPLFVVAMLLILGGVAVVSRSGFDGEPRGQGAAALATIDVIVGAQETFREQVRVDRDGDGVGEAGFYFELAGFPSLRPTPDQMQPTLITKGLRPGPPEFVVGAGYRFRLLLPGAEGGWVSSPDKPVDTDAAESRFVVLAWPDAPLAGEDRLFCVSADGRRFVAHDSEGRWVGHREPPLPAGLDSGSAEGPAWVESGPSSESN